MLVWVPPMNSPLIRLPFFNSKESARAVTAATHRATIAPHICFPFITSSPVYSLFYVAFEPGGWLFAGRLMADRVRPEWLSGSLPSSEPECLFAASRREALQQFLGSLIEPFLVLLLFFAGFDRMLGSTYPNELSCGRVIHTDDESPDVIA